MFADNLALYKGIRTLAVCELLQSDLHNVSSCMVSIMDTLIELNVITNNEPIIISIQLNGIKFHSHLK